MLVAAAAVAAGWAVYRALGLPAADPPDARSSCRVAALDTMNMRRELPESPYLAAAGGRKPSRVPVWFMRQAGRSLPEYRELRAKNTMMQACFDAELITEITLQPVRRHGVDAAILFSDIVVPLRASGIGLDIVPDVGPVIEHPVRTAADVAALQTARTAAGRVGGRRDRNAGGRAR